MNPAPNEKLAPHSVEAEQTVIGSILLNPDYLYEVNTFLHPKHFFIVKHGWIFQAIQDLNEKNLPVDPDILAEKLKEQGRFEDVGGREYLLTLMNSGSFSNHVEVFGRIVQHAWMRRALLLAAGSIAQKALEANETIETLLSESTNLIDAIQEQNPDEIESVGQIASRYFDKVEALYRHETTSLGIPTGYTELDRLLSGFQGGDLIVIGAPPRIGKTAFALNIAVNISRRCEQGIYPFPVWFVSLEMEREQLINRVIGCTCNLNTMNLQTGDLTEEQWNQFTDGLSMIEPWPLLIDDDPDMTVQKLRSKARKLRHTAGIKAIFVDYLQLIHDPDFRKDREQEISSISRGLKLLAKELGIPVVVCAQLNRQVEQRADHRPMLSDLRESGAIEQNADIVIFLYRDDIYNENSERPNECDLIVAKHRNGPTGVATLYFRKEYTQFTNLERSRIDLSEEWQHTPQHYPTPPRRPAPIHLSEDDTDEE